MSKTIKYKLVLYYDTLIDADNPKLVTETIMFDDELYALKIGKYGKYAGIYMFEVFAETKYYKKNIIDTVNIIRWGNFIPINNKNIL